MDFPKVINGKVEHTSEVIVHKKIEVKKEVPKTVSKNANGSATVFTGGITYRSSATEIMVGKDINYNSTGQQFVRSHLVICWCLFGNRNRWDLTTQRD